MRGYPWTVAHARPTGQRTHSSLVQYQLNSKDVYRKVFKMSFQCQECHQSFPYKRNLTRHIKTVHGNEPRKDNEARKQGLLAGLYSETFGDPVESIPQAVFKSPVDYFAVAMKGSFTKNKSLLRHVRTGHQGMKRTDNEKQCQKAGAPCMYGYPYM